MEAQLVNFLEIERTPEYRDIILGPILKNMKRRKISKKRFKKKLMSVGFPRNAAELVCKIIGVKASGFYSYKDTAERCCPWMFD